MLDKTRPVEIESAELLSDMFKEIGDPWRMC